MRNATTQAVTVVDRRAVDRRACPTPLFSRFSLAGGQRRDHGRRIADTVEFVDQYGAGLFLVVVSIVALNFLDAWFTVLFLSLGGTELNPVVDSLLGLGTAPFIALKSAGIGLCVALLTMTKNFTIARAGLGLVLVGYLALLGWHLWLYQHAPIS